MLLRMGVVVCLSEGVVWLFLGDQNEGLISTLDCDDGLAKPTDVKVLFLLSPSPTLSLFV